MAAKKKIIKEKNPSVSPKKSKTTSSSKKQIGTCFVLMPFKEPFDTYYSTIIKPAVIGANLNIKRGDSIFTPTPIMGDIWKMIQEANVIIAELTGKNPNVFYELGLGHALGKPIVLISETMDDVPFDLQQLRVILYDKDNPTWGNKLKNSITTALQETLTNPIEAVPPMFRKKVKSQAPSDSETSLRLSTLESKVSSIMRRFQYNRFVPQNIETKLNPSTSVIEREWSNMNQYFSSPEDVAQWVRELRKKYNPSAINKFLENEFGTAEAEKIILLSISKDKQDK